MFPPLTWIYLSVAADTGLQCRRSPGDDDDDSIQAEEVKQNLYWFFLFALLLAVQNHKLWIHFLFSIRAIFFF